MWRSLNVDDTEIMLLEEHSSTYRIEVPFDPKVRFIEWVNNKEVSDGTIMIWADWIKVRLNDTGDLRQI